MIYTTEMLESDMFFDSSELNSIEPVVYEESQSINSVAVQILAETAYNEVMMNNYIKEELSIVTEGAVIEKIKKVFAVIKQFIQNVIAKIKGLFNKQKNALEDRLKKDIIQMEKLKDELVNAQKQISKYGVDKSKVSKFDKEIVTVNKGYNWTMDLVDFEPLMKKEKDLLNKTLDLATKDAEEEYENGDGALLNKLEDLVQSIKEVIKYQKDELSATEKDNKTIGNTEYKIYRRYLLSDLYSDSLPINCITIDIECSKKILNSKSYFDKYLKLLNQMNKDITDIEKRFLNSKLYKKESTINYCIATIKDSTSEICKSLPELLNLEFKAELETVASDIKMAQEIISYCKKITNKG